MLAAAVCAQEREPTMVPSRAPQKGCVWARLDAPELGLELFHEKCDFGFRTVTHVASAKDGTVYEALRDTGTRRESLEPIIVMFDAKEGEPPAAAIKRAIFPAMKRRERKNCVVVRKKLGFLDSIGKAAYVIVPSEDYAAELARDAGDEIPPAPCGARGVAADAFTYFEFNRDENPRRFAYVDFGQDEHPLFDERSLTFLPPTN
jgi:hypothetical protein